MAIPGEFRWPPVGRNRCPLTVKEIDRLLKTLVAETAPELNAVDGVGTDVASAILWPPGTTPNA